MIRTTITADDELLYRIERIAKQQGKSKAAVIREALTEYVVTQEAEMLTANPLVSIIGLAGAFAVPTDISDGADEEYLRTHWTTELETDGQDEGQSAIHCPLEQTRPWTPQP